MLAERDWITPILPEQTEGYGSSHADFHAEYSGGWHLLFPNTGAACEVLGTPLPFHGEVARQVWTVERESKSSVVMTTISRLPLHVSRFVEIIGSKIRIVDTVTNLSPVEIPFIAGHHPVFPLTDSIRLDMPRAAAAVLHNEALADPAALERHLSSGGFPDQSIFGAGLGQPFQALVSITELADTWFSVRGLPDKTGVAMCWDADIMPNMWLWAENLSKGFPWFGRAQFLGLEPQTAAGPEGLATAIDQGTHLVLAPFSTVDIWIEAFVFVDEGAAVTNVAPGEGPQW